MTDNRTTELLKEFADQFSDAYPSDDIVSEYAERIEQAIAATLRGGMCHITASSTDGLCSDNPRQYFELSCGHSFTLDGLEPPNYCEVCGAKVVG